MAKKHYSFRFDELLIAEVQKLAEKDNRTLTNYIETLLREKLSIKGKEKKK